MTVITPEQRRAAAEAGDEPVELADPQTGDSYVLVRADVFRRMRELLERRGSPRARGLGHPRAKGAGSVGRGESVLMIRPGEI